MAQPDAVPQAPAADAPAHCSFFMKAAAPWENSALMTALHDTHAASVFESREMDPVTP